MNEQQDNYCNELETGFDICLITNQFYPNDFIPDNEENELVSPQG